MIRGMIILASLFTISSADDTDELLEDEGGGDLDLEQRRNINRWQHVICIINILIALAIYYCWVNSSTDIDMERDTNTNTKRYEEQSTKSTMDCSSSCETCNARRTRSSRDIPSSIYIAGRRVSKADAVPIMSQHINEEEDDDHIKAEQMYQYRKFATSTWSMYNRITSARQARAKCQICFGSMEDEEEAIVQACPSPLHRGDEEQGKESSLLLNQTHKECYYGAVTEQTCRVCPRKLLKSYDNMIFDLDL